MFGRLGRKLSDWYVPAMEAPEPARSGRERDILAEERNRRRGWFWMLRGGPVAGYRLILFGAVFGVIGLGYTALGLGGDDDPAVGRSALDGGLGSGGRSSAVFLDEGVGAADYGAAIGYGQVVGEGPGGRPVVAVEGSSEVRELTEVEVEFGRGDVVREVPEKDGALWNPGPRGLGLWWRLGRRSCRVSGRRERAARTGRSPV